ncbi:MAG: C40 family peptidase [Actinomycetes bacterium]
MPTRASARHRAAIRPKTPLTGLTSSLTSCSVGRRSAVIAASSGLLLTGALPVANATPVAAPLAARAAEARPAAQRAEVAPEVTVPADAPVTFASTALTTATPPPPPPPVAAPAPQPQPQPQPPQERASRSEQRQSLAAPAHAIAATPAAATASSSTAGGSILAIAARYVGVPYRYGGNTPAGFDCSGYTQYVYAQVGISLPHSSGGQAAGGRRISAAQAQPGDLVYTPGHIGIYAGGNMMYDAPRTGLSVTKRAIWFTPTFITYR